MKTCGVVLALVMLMAGTASAKDNLSEQRIGYVDLQRALNQVSEGKRAKSELERAFQKRQNELQSLQKTLEQTKKNLEKDRLILSAEALQKKEEAYRGKFLELSQKMNAFKAELAQKETETTGAILNAVRRVVQKIGKDEGYEVILETSQNVVLYSQRHADLTDRVITMYNKLPKSQRRIPVQ